MSSERSEEVDRPGLARVSSERAVLMAFSSRVEENFQRGVGTYLKVVRFADPTNPDAFIVLYLRPGDSFLLAGYWSGYERSVVGGRWTKDGDVVSLEGRGQTETDSPPDEAGRFRRTLSWRLENHTPVLGADGGLKEWSLLGWQGPFVYVGQLTVIDPDGQWLPKSMDEVDGWIAKLSNR